jgi:hypothetical protein
MTDAELEALPSINSLDWYGEVKKAGFDTFFMLQELVMRDDGKGLVSRR